MNAVPAISPARITAAEMERRREMVRQADANNRLEGIFREPETDTVFDAFVRGDIEATDLIRHFKAPGASR